MGENGQDPIGFMGPHYFIHQAAGASLSLPPTTAFTPSQIRHAYGFDLVANQGAGQTIALVDAYIGPDGVLTGSARMAQEARERASADARQQHIQRQHRTLMRKRVALERQVQEMRTELEAEEAEMMTLIGQDEARESVFEADRGKMASNRGVKV